SPQAFSSWQLDTYEQIAKAWQTLESEYEDKLAALQYQQVTLGPLGAADPETNRQIERTEIKRSCIALLDNNNATVRGVGNRVAVDLWPQPPTGDILQLPEPILNIAEDIGATVRWFEQAFEWENIGYIFYPYYWGRREEWIARLNLQNSDPLFTN